jgi:hypothetical protein
LFNVNEAIERERSSMYSGSRTYNLESIYSAANTDFPNFGVHIFLVTDEFYELDIDAELSSEWLKLRARTSGQGQSLG